MVEIISKENMHLYTDIMEDMHRMRYRIAVSEWGWRIPGIKPGYDKDNFDTEETIYFVSLSKANGRVVACGRLNPTTGPNLLRDVFPHHCQFEEVPCDPAIYELSRYIVDHRALSKEEMVVTRGQISSAFNSFCIQSGIRAVSVLTYMSSYARSLKYWPTRPLGRPVYYKEDNATYIAALCQMSTEGLEKLRSGFSLAKDQPRMTARFDNANLPPIRRIQSLTAGHTVAA